MLALALSAQAAGHDALLCAPPNFAGWVREHGVAFHPTGQDVEALMARQAAAATGGALKVLRGFAGLLREEVRAQLRDLPAALSAHRAELVIGGGVALAAPILAEAAGIPFHLTIYCPTLLRSSHHAPMLVPWQRLPRWLNRLLWRLNDALFARLLLPILNEERARLGRPAVRDFYAHCIGTGVIVAADEALAPLPPDLGIPIIRCGAPHLPARGALDPRIDAFLAAGPPPVYCGFGSMPDPRPARTAAMLIAAAQAAGARLILSRGWARLDAGQVPEGALVIDGAPHDLLFPRVAAVVHHGGAGTTASAARAGVPQVIIPHLLDQHYWGARLHAFGAAPPPLRRTRLSTGRLSAALRAALTPEAAQRARDLAARFTPPPTFAGLLQAIDQHHHRRRI